MACLTPALASSNATFTLDVSIKFRGYTAAGLSFWLEAQNALAPHISITNVTYFTFLDPNQSGIQPYSIPPLARILAS